MATTVTAAAAPRAVAQADVRLEVRDLYRSYGPVRALAGLSLTVRAGRVTGILGANGAGKSTAMEVVLGLSRPETGAVLWDGRPIDGATRRHFGYMPEQRALYPRMSAAHEVAYFARLHGMSAAAAAAGAQRVQRALGLVHRAAERVDRLSHGNQQRVQLAATLVHDPELLLLDEPFSGLDPVGIDAMAGLLRDRAAAGASILFSSHQLDVVEHLCDDVVIIDAGRSVLSGDMDSVRRHGPRDLVVAVDGAPPGWQRTLGERTVLDQKGCARVRLEPGDDLDRLLDAARRAGTVTAFGVEQRPLSQLFREAVRR